MAAEFPGTGEGAQPDLLFVSRGVKLRLYERQGVAEYWIVDPEAGGVDVWRFEADPRHERFVDRLPVRIGDEAVGEIDLAEVFETG